MGQQTVSHWSRWFRLSILYVIPLIGISGVGIAAIIGLTDYAILGSYLAVPMIAAPVLYHYTDRDKRVLPHQPIDIRLLWIGYLLSISIAIAIMAITDSQTAAVYLLLTFTGLAIFIQIFHTSASAKNILTQIVILSLVIIWGVSLLPHFYLGGTDTIPHAWWIERLARGDLFSAAFGRYEDVYSAFPLWHILNVAAVHITGTYLGSHMTMLIVNGFVYATIPIAIFAIAQRITSREVALLSSLFTVYNSYYVYYGALSISRSAVALLLILTFWTLLRYPAQRSVIILFVLIVSTALYHAASAPFVIFLVVAYYALWLLLIDDRESVAIPSYRVLSIAITFVLIYWMIASPAVLETLVNRVIGAIFVETSPASTGGATRELNVLARYINYVHYAPIVLFIIIASLTVLKSDMDQIRSLTVFVLLGLVSIGLTAPGPSLIFEQFSDSLNFERWGLYTVLFLSVATAVGVVNLYDTPGIAIPITVILLITVAMFGGISSDLVSDQPLLKTDTHTGHLTAEETTAIHHAGNHTSEAIHSDFIVSRYMEFSEYNSQQQLIHVDENTGEVLTETDQSLLLVRYGELEQRPLKVYTTNDGVIHDNPSQNSRYEESSSVWNQLSSKSKIYDTGSTDIYI